MRSMSPISSLVLIVGGAAMTVAGIDMTRSLSTTVGHFFTSSPTDHAIWMMIVGIPAMIFGLIGAWRSRRPLR